MPASLTAAADPILEPFATSREEDETPWQIYCADARHALYQLPGRSVNCVVTSPPYYWQRDYGVEGQLGLEASVEAYVENIVSVFRGIRHVLRPDGVVFLNLGDTYYSKKGRPHGRDDKHRGRQLARTTLRAVDGPGLGLPRKSLLGIPWRTALGLANDGWTLRADVIWVRRTAMPEPTAGDRPWRHHEHVFILSASPRYFFNRDALEGEEDVWHIEPERQNPVRGQHYAPYPVALVERCLGAGCPDDGTVLDPFAGGGTTLAVARDRGLASIGIELNPAFCEVIEDRLR
jgi:site-specific DNA-methyltransferase (adenine-specific)